MKKIILNIVKYAICKILWCLILCKFFNFIPDPFIRKFIEDEFYKYIYRPIFNYVKIMQKHADQAIRKILDNLKK